MIDLLNQYGPSWAAYFAAAIVQNTLFLVLVFIVLHRLRSASARVRYAVGVVGLVKLLLPPFVPLRFQTAAVIHRAEGITEALRFMPAGGSVSMAEPAPELGVPGLLLALWAAIAALYILCAIVSTVRLAVTLRGAVPIPDEDVRGLYAARGIRVHMTERIAVPMTLAIYPRRIFVPVAWEHWSEDCRRMVLRHETAHIMRKDGAVQALQIVAHAIYFFHPLILILGRRLGELREMACDDLSAGSDGCAGAEYSKLLIEITESIVRTPATCESASTLLTKKNELLNRVRYQMKGGAMVSKGKTAVILTVLLLLVLPLSWYRTGAEPEGRAQAHAERAGPGERLTEGQEKPPAPPGAPAEPAAPEHPAGGSITIAVSGDERIVVEGEAIAWDMVKEQLKKIMGGDSEKVIRLQCADDTPMERIHWIHEVLRETGHDKIEYRNGEGYGEPLVLPPADIEERLSEIGAQLIVDLHVDASGKVTLDGESIEPSELGDVVAKRLEQTPHLVVTVQTMNQTAYKDFLGVLAALRKAGAKRIVIQEPTGP